MVSTQEYKARPRMRMRDSLQWRLPSVTTAAQRLAAGTTQLQRERASKPYTARALAAAVRAAPLTAT